MIYCTRCGTNVVNPYELDHKFEVREKDFGPDTRYGLHEACAALLSDEKSRAKEEIENRRAAHSILRHATKQSGKSAQDERS